jgi:ABC-type phosphate transport system substrate-binding protein
MASTAALLALALLISVASASSCGPKGGSIAIAGSTTVAPITSAWVKAYMVKCSDITITTEEGGSTDGAARVCATSSKSPVDIGDMSRYVSSTSCCVVVVQYPLTCSGQSSRCRQVVSVSTEMLSSRRSQRTSCSHFVLQIFWHREWNGIEATTDFSGYKYRCVNSTRKVIQIEVAIDGLSITMESNGTAADCVRSMGGLTPEQLRWMYSSYTVEELAATDWNLTSIPGNDGDDTTHLWSELSPDCAAEEIKIAGPDESSGTYEFFRETILTDYKNGESFGGGATGYFNSATDEEIVAYVESDGAVIGYYGYAYYIREGSRLYAAPIQNYAGDFVPPTEASVYNATYFPLSRRLFMNLLDDPKSLANTGPFIEFGMSEEGADLVHDTGYVPIPPALSELMIRRVQDRGSSGDSSGPSAASQNGGGNKSSSLDRYDFSSFALSFLLSAIVTVWPSFC